MRYTTVIAVLLGTLAVAAQDAAAQGVSYKVLATSKTSTMERELKEAGETGYHFVAVMGGETAIGGKEVVVLMEKADNDKTRYEYRLLATSKTSTLQRELEQASAGGWQAVGQTVFESVFGGQEAVAILEKNSEQPSNVRYEFRLVATTKTSTLAKELQQLADQGFRAVAMTVGKTALGGSELVVVTRRLVK